MNGYLTVIKETDGTYVPGGDTREVLLGCDRLGYDMSPTFLNESGVDVGLVGASYHDLGINEWTENLIPVTKITDRCTGNFFYVTQKISDVFDLCCEKDLGLCRTFQINARCLIINGQHININ